MSYEVEFVDLQEQHIAVVRARVAHQGIAEFLGQAFGEVMGAVARQGLPVAGAPFGRYRPTDDGGWDIEAGFPVHGTLSAEGRVEPSVLPAGRAAKTLHVGGYAEVAAAYQAATAWLTDNGYVPAGVPWECYLDGPEVPRPRTEVFLPCHAAAPVHAG